MMVDVAEAPAPARHLPALNDDNRAFWTGGASGELLICRCQNCGTYYHPPRPRCAKCLSEDVKPEAVSGKARVATYTVNYQAWMPGLRVPYVFAAVELAEQAELYVLTNIIGIDPESVRKEMPVEVTFEEADGIFLPLFRPSEDAHG